MVKLLSHGDDLDKADLQVARSLIRRASAFWELLDFASLFIHIHPQPKPNIKYPPTSYLRNPNFQTPSIDGLICSYGSHKGGHGSLRQG